MKRAHRRVHTVGADQQVGAGAAAVGEVRGDTILPFVDANQLLGVVDSHTGSLGSFPKDAV